MDTWQKMKKVDVDAHFFRFLQFQTLSVVPAAYIARNSQWEGFWRGSGGSAPKIGRFLQTNFGVYTY